MLQELKLEGGPWRCFVFYSRQLPGWDDGAAACRHEVPRWSWGTQQGGCCYQDKVSAAHRGFFLQFLTRPCTPGQVQPEQVQKWHWGAVWEMLLQGSASNLLYHPICSCMNQVKLLLCLCARLCCAREQVKGKRVGKRTKLSVWNHGICGWVRSGTQLERDKELFPLPVLFLERRASTWFS